VKIESIDVAETIKTTKALIETEASLSLDLKEALDQLLYVTKLMFDRLTNMIGIFKKIQCFTWVT
jgi:hypothetical protein